jgi:hypothetical protein
MEGAVLLLLLPVPSDLLVLFAGSFDEVEEDEVEEDEVVDVDAAGLFGFDFLGFELELLEWATLPTSSIIPPLTPALIFFSKLETSLFAINCRSALLASFFTTIFSLDNNTFARDLSLGNSPKILDSSHIEVLRNMYSLLLRPKTTMSVSFFQ